MLKCQKCDVTRLKMCISCEKLAQQRIFETCSGGTIDVADVKYKFARTRLTPALRSRGEESITLRYAASVGLLALSVWRPDAKSTRNGIEFPEELPQHAFHRSTNCGRRFQAHFTARRCSYTTGGLLITKHFGNHCGGVAGVVFTTSNYKVTTYSIEMCWETHPNDDSLQRKWKIPKLLSRGDH